MQTLSTITIYNHLKRKVHQLQTSFFVYVSNCLIQCQAKSFKHDSWSPRQLSQGERRGKP